MNDDLRQVDSLTAADFVAYPVWEFTTCESGDETMVRPVIEFPVSTAAGKVIGTQVKLASGRLNWAMIATFDNENSYTNSHFLSIAVERNGTWFELARYHDMHYSRNGPQALANFLQLRTEEIFPISYDLRELFSGNPQALVGRIPQEPYEKLSRAELIALAVPKRSIAPQ